MRWEFLIKNILVVSCLYLLLYLEKVNDNTKPTFLIDMKYNTMSESPIERNNSLAGFTLGQSIF
jgi:hypothetical protein